MSAGEAIGCVAEPVERSRVRALYAKLRVFGFARKLAPVAALGHAMRDARDADARMLAMAAAVQRSDAGHKLILCPRNSFREGDEN